MNRCATTGTAADSACRWPSISVRSSEGRCSQPASAICSRNLWKRAANSLTSSTAVIVPGSVQAAGRSLSGVGPDAFQIGRELSPPDPLQGAVFLQIDDEGIL